MRSILIMYHCESNTGYAIGRLEPVFYDLALQLCDGDASRIHISYPSMTKGPSSTLPASFNQYCIIDPGSADPKEHERIGQYVAQHNIDTLFAFDQPVHRPLYRVLRESGLKHFISYWGAPISSIFGPLKRLLKRMDVLRHRDGPDHYIFESQGMADTAVLGRGIPRSWVDVIYLSVDTELFKPNAADAQAVYQAFNIPENRRIFFYSGHMEERKGVHVLVRAAHALYEQYGRRDFHLLILGNKNGEKRAFDSLMGGEHANHITFGGYRDDIPLLHRGCFAGMIGSTGWDSLTCSALEMGASGLPLLVSDMPGLKESVVDGKTGYLFPSGNAAALAEKMNTLLENPQTASQLGAAARKRAIDEFSQAAQQKNLLAVMKKVLAK